MSYSPSFTNPEGLSPNAFGSEMGVYSEAVTTPYDIYEPQEFIQLIEQHNKPASYRMLLKNSGFSRAVRAPTTGHYEAPWYKSHLVVGSVIYAAGVASVVLDASSLFAFVDAAGATRYGSYPIVSDVIELPSRKQGRISAKTTVGATHTCTIIPLDSTVPFVAGDFTAGERIFIVYNLQGEGMPLPGSRQSRVTKYTNTFAITAAAVSTTGSELTNATYFEVKPGVRGSFFEKGFDDMMMRHEDDCDNLLIFGQQTNNTGLAVTPTQLGYPVDVKGTEGLIDFGLTNGYDETWDPLTGYLIQDFNDITAIYEGERVGTQLMVLQGFKAFQAVEDTLVDYVRQTEVSLVNQETGGSTTVSVGIGKIRKTGYDIIFKKVPAFSDVKGAGTAGYDYESWMIYMPWGFTADKSTGFRTGTVGYEWKQLGGYSRENTMIKLDGTGYGRVATQSDDIYTCGIRSEIAAHNACANQIVIQRP